MDLPRHQLLPGATLSGDQYGRRCGRHLPDDGKDLLHRRGGSHQVPEYAMQTQFALQCVGFLQASLVTDRAFQEGLEGARFHRLFQEPRSRRVLKARGSTGFSRNQNALRSCTADSAFSMLPKPVSAIAGVRSPRSFKCRSSSKPSMRGIIKSVTTTSALKAASRSSASCPSAATCVSKSDSESMAAKALR